MQGLTQPDSWQSLLVSEPWYSGISSPAALIFQAVPGAVKPPIAIWLFQHVSARCHCSNICPRPDQSADGPDALPVDNCSSKIIWLNWFSLNSHILPTYFSVVCHSVHRRCAFISHSSSVASLVHCLPSVPPLQSEPPFLHTPQAGNLTSVLNISVKRCLAPKASDSFLLQSAGEGHAAIPWFTGPSPLEKVQLLWWAAASHTPPWAFLVEVPKPETQQQVESKARITRFPSPQLQCSQHPHQNVPSLRHNHCWRSNHNALYPRFPQVRLALVILKNSWEEAGEGVKKVVPGQVYVLSGIWAYAAACQTCKITGWGQLWVFWH